MPIDLINKELISYFKGELKRFNTPYKVFGSQFQQEVWQALCAIPYGETISYKEQAVYLNKPNSYRAAANANGANQLAIIIPLTKTWHNDAQ